MRVAEPPTNWKTVRLEDICVSDAPIMYGILQPGEDLAKGVPYVRPTEIQDDYINLSEIKRTSVSIAQQYRRSQIQEGDLLITIVGTLGKIAIVPRDLNGGNITQSSARIRVNSELAHNHYVKHFLRSSPIAIEQYNRHRLGTGVPRLNIHHVRDIMIPLPPLPEQRRIADILDKADAIRRKRREASVELESFLHGVFTNLFGYPDANPHKWPIRHFSEVCDTRLGKMLDAKQQTGHHNRPYMRNLNVQWGHIDLSQVYKMDFNESDRKEFRLKYGDVLICEGGAGVGQTAIWRDELEECYFQKSLHRARPNQGLATPEYIAFLMWILMNGSSLRRSISSATIPHLTGEKLKEVKIPVPPYELQQKFSSICLRLSESREKAEQSLKYTTALFESLVQNAFSGALR